MSVATLHKNILHPAPGRICVLWQESKGARALIRRRRRSRRFLKERCARQRAAADLGAKPIASKHPPLKGGSLLSGRSCCPGAASVRSGKERQRHFAPVGRAERMLSSRVLQWRVAVSVERRQPLRARVRNRLRGRSSYPDGIDVILVTGPYCSNLAKENPGKRSDCRAFPLFQRLCNGVPIF